MPEQLGRIKPGEIGQLHTEFRHGATVTTPGRAAAQVPLGPRAGALPIWLDATATLKQRDAGERG
jgi:hypothetical protein